MNEKITIAFNDKAKEILKNIYPEMRNAAVNVAVMMLAKDPMFAKYFCMECDEQQAEEQQTTLENIDNSNSNNNNQQPRASVEAPVNALAWDEF